MNYNENQLTDLARNNPKELVRILTSPDVEARLLAGGVEILGGESSDEELVLPVFRKLLRHVNAMVREGTIMGVSAFFVNKKPPRDILDRLKAIATSDPSPSNKKTAKGFLEELEG